VFLSLFPAQRSGVPRPDTAAAEPDTGCGNTIGALRFTEPRHPNALPIRHASI